MGYYSVNTTSRKAKTSHMEPMCSSEDLRCGCWLFMKMSNTRLSHFDLRSSVSEVSNIEQKWLLYELWQEDFPEKELLAIQTNPWSLSEEESPCKRTASKVRSLEAQRGAPCPCSSHSFQ